MKKYLLVVLVGSVLTLAVPGASADLGVDVKAGTLGAGVELSKGLSDKWSVGLGFNAYTFKKSGTTSDVDYDYKFELQSVSMLASYHPFTGIFRLTGGLLYDNNDLLLTGKPSAGSTYTLNGVTYTAAQVGSLAGKLTFNKTAPYIGIGFGNRPNSKFGLSADLGALYQSSPKLALSASGALGNAALASDLEAERIKAESDLSKYKWYPVVSLGLYYRF